MINIGLLISRMVAMWIFVFKIFLNPICSVFRQAYSKKKINNEIKFVLNLLPSRIVGTGAKESKASNNGI